LALVASTSLLIPRPALAHGLFGHVHVTGWAIENLPRGELRDMFRDPAVSNAAYMGAVFPDTGYALATAASGAYGEYAHWEPFVEALIQHIRTTYGPTYDTLEERRLIAFLMGVASHGLQDEVFDSTFLHETEQRDGHSAEATDPGTDAFLVFDGHARMYPDAWVPMDDVLPLFAGLGQPIDAPLIENQLNIVFTLYMNDEFGRNTAYASADEYEAQIPWAREHYLDPEVAGSLRAEIGPTAAYMQAIWDRLHGRFDDSNLIIYAYPHAPRRLREADHTSAASWVTVIFGRGVKDYSATASVVDSSGASVPVDFKYTRWAGTGYSRLVRFQVTTDYQPGETYTATMNAGATLVDGSVTATPQSVTYQVDCNAEGDPRCPLLRGIKDPTLEPPPASDGCAVSGAGASSTGVVALLVAGVVLARRRRSAA